MAADNVFWASLIRKLKGLESRLSDEEGPFGDTIGAKDPKDDLELLSGPLPGATITMPPNWLFPTAAETENTPTQLLATALSPHTTMKDTFVRGISDYVQPALVTNVTTMPFHEPLVMCNDTYPPPHAAIPTTRLPLDLPSLNPNGSTHHVTHGGASSGFSVVLILLCLVQMYRQRLGTSFSTVRAYPEFQAPARDDIHLVAAENGQVSAIEKESIVAVEGESAIAPETVQVGIVEDKPVSAPEARSVIATEDQQVSVKEDQQVCANEVKPVSATENEKVGVSEGKVVGAVEEGPVIATKDEKATSSLPLDTTPEHVVLNEDGSTTAPESMQRDALELLKSILDPIVEGYRKNDEPWEFALERFVDDVDMFQDRSRDLQTELDTSKTANQELQTEVTQLKDEKQTLQKSVTDVTKEKTKSDNKLQNKGQEIAGLNSRHTKEVNELMEKHLQEVQDLQTQNNNLKSRADKGDKLKSDLAMARKDSSDKTENMKKLQGSNEKLERQISSVQKKLTDSSKNLEAQNVTNASLQTELQQAKDKVTSKTEAETDFTNQIAALKSQHELDLNHKVTTLNAQHEDELQRAMAEQSTQHANKDTALSAIHTAILSGKDNKINLLEQSHSIMEEQLRLKQEALQNSESSKAKWIQTCIAKDKEIADADSSCAMFEKRSDDKGDIIKNLWAAEERLEAELSSRDEDLEKKDRDIEQLKAHHQAEMLAKNEAFEQQAIELTAARASLTLAQSASSQRAEEWSDYWPQQFGGALLVEINTDHCTMPKPGTRRSLTKKARKLLSELEEATKMAQERLDSYECTGESLKVRNDRQNKELSAAKAETAAAQRALKSINKQIATQSGVNPAPVAASVHAAESVDSEAVTTAVDTGESEESKDTAKLVVRLPVANPATASEDVATEESGEDNDETMPLTPPAAGDAATISVDTEVSEDQNVAATPLIRLPAAPAAAPSEDVENEKSTEDTDGTAPLTSPAAVDPALIPLETDVSEDTEVAATPVIRAATTPSPSMVFNAAAKPFRPAATRSNPLLQSIWAPPPPTRPLAPPTGPRLDSTTPDRTPIALSPSQQRTHRHQANRDGYKSRRLRFGY